MPVDRHIIVQKQSQLDEMLRELRAASTIAFDLETTGFEADGYGATKDTIVGWAFSTAPRCAWYVPVGHYQGPQLDADMVAAALKPIFEDQTKKFLIHNAKFDTHFVRALGININYNHVDDTMLEAAVVGYKDQLQRVGLKYITGKVWQYRQKEFHELFGKVKEKNIATVTIDNVGWYACDDADYCFRIHERYYNFIQGHPKLKHIYDLESLLWPLTQKIEDTGVYADEGFSNAAIDYLRSEAAKVYSIIVDQIVSASAQNKLAGGSGEIWNPESYPKPPHKKGEPYAYWLIGFNPASDAQLRDVLFNVLSLRAVKTTKAGRESTGKLTLDRLGKDLPVCKNISTYKQILDAVSKLRNEIIGAIKPDGRAHTNYNQVGTRSGRYSSSNPNFQNLARLKKWTVHNLDGSTYEVILSLRDAIRATPGYYLIEFDFSAIEFAIYAKFAGDTNVVYAYEHDLDVHKQTARDLFNVPEDKVTKDQRDLAKQINYLIIYEGTGVALSLRTELSKIDADQMIDQFFRVRPKFKQYANIVHKEVQKTHVVWTVFGRPIYIAELDSDSEKDRMKGFRAAVNGGVQGTAADVHKKGLLRVDDRVHSLYSTDQARMILQTHDSQTWEVRRDIAPEDFIPIVLANMPTQHILLPNIRVDASVGVSWGSTQKYDPTVDYTARFAELDAEYQEKIDRMAAATVPEPAKADLIIPKPSVKSKKKRGDNIELILDGQLTMQTADALVILLDRHKGNNVVTLVDSDGGRDVLIEHPTNLSAKLLQSSVASFLPKARTAVDKQIIFEDIAETLV